MSALSNTSNIEYIRSLKVNSWNSWPYSKRLYTFKEFGIWILSPESRGEKGYKRKWIYFISCCIKHCDLVCVKKRYKTQTVIPDFYIRREVKLIKGGYDNWITGAINNAIVF